ncbi:unnamed protein product, partial [Allacma fusca]
PHNKLAERAIAVNIKCSNQLRCRRLCVQGIMQANEQRGRNERCIRLILGAFRIQSSNHFHYFDCGLRRPNGKEMADENSKGNSGCRKENTNTAAITAGPGRSVDTIATYKRSRPGSVSLKVLLLSEPANEEAKR